MALLFQLGSGALPPARPGPEPAGLGTAARPGRVARRPGSRCASSAPGRRGAAGVAGDDVDRQRKLLHHAAVSPSAAGSPSCRTRRPPPQGSSTAANSFMTTVQTPVKKPGRNWPSRMSARAGSGWILKVWARGTGRVRAVQKTMSQSAASSRAQVGVPGARVAIKIFVWQELQAVHEDAGHVSASGLALRTRAMWPSCRLPMVGTKAGRWRPAGQARSSGRCGRTWEVVMFTRRAGCRPGSCRS